MSALIDGVRAAGFVSADQVLAMRREFYADGAIGQAEAEQLWQLARIVPAGDPSWAVFFIEALADHFVEGSEPKGYIDDNQAARLIKGLSQNGAYGSAMEFELLIKLIEKSRSVPDAITTFAHQAIRHTILLGHGCTRHGHSEPGVITTSDVAYLRRLLYASAGVGHHGISHLEAELLFDLNDATIEAKNVPEWSDLFTKAIAGYLMAHIGYKPPCREESLRRSAWLDDTSVNVGAFMAGMGSLAGFSELFSRDDKAARQRVEHEAAVAEAELITARESAWLAERIARDGILHENEMALINYMKTLGAELPACLRAKIAELSDGH